MILNVGHDALCFSYFGCVRFFNTSLFLWTSTFFSTIFPQSAKYHIYSLYAIFAMIFKRQATVTAVFSVAWRTTAVYIFWHILYQRYEGTLVALVQRFFETRFSVEEASFCIHQALSYRNARELVLSHQLQQDFCYFKDTWYRHYLNISISAHIIS